MIDADAAAGIVPRWHDESAWNRYLIDHPPTLTLGCDYCRPRASRPIRRRLLLLARMPRNCERCNGCGSHALRGNRVELPLRANGSNAERCNRAVHHAERGDRHGNIGSAGESLCALTWMREAKRLGTDAVFLMGTPEIGRPQRYRRPACVALPGRLCKPAAADPLILPLGARSKLGRQFNCRPNQLGISLQVRRRHVRRRRSAAVIRHRRAATTSAPSGSPASVTPAAARAISSAARPPRSWPKS